MTTSGITGLTLPGMIEEPACTAGRRISPKPARGPLESRRRSLQIFDSLTATRFSTPENSTKAPMSEVASIRLAAGTIGSCGSAREFLDRQRGVARIGIDAGADRGGAEIDFAKQRRRLPEARDVFLDGGKEGVEFLAERHRHRVLQLGAADLENVAEFDGLGLEGVGEFVERFDQRTGAQR